MLKLTLIDWMAMCLSLLAIGVSWLVSERVYEAMPHLEDEIAYVWQARLIASGQLTIPSPEFSKSFMVPFVVDYEGQRFGKYPLGWPVLLGIGEFLDIRQWVNPLLAGLAVWFIYRLGKRVFGEQVGILGTFLTVSSPFFLLNTGSLLSHPMGLLLATAFTLFWLDLFGSSSQNSGRYEWVKLITAGLTLGLLVLSRPFSAVAVALPFAAHGMWLLWREDWDVRRRLIALGVLVASLSSLHFVWQAAVTGDPLLNPYTLWWEYDKVGFGPGVGRADGGHTLRLAWLNMRYSLAAGYSDLFGWPQLSWIALPFGLLAIRNNRHGWLVAAIFPALLVLHMGYWVGSWLFGPRYYFEGMQSLVLISAAGIACLAGWGTHPIHPGGRFHGLLRLRPWIVAGVLAVFVGYNLFGYLPDRLQGMVNLYEIGRYRQQPFLSAEAEAMTPALIIVDAERWMPYGALLDLQDPHLTSPFIFAYHIGPVTDAALAASYPDRNVYYYYADDEPWIFYTAPRGD
jgi:4-amino-4-deoxy-L-arabinose transferase-like glycosyltransferase